MRSYGVSVPAYLSVSESERYGSTRTFLPWIWTRNPLWPSHQTCMPGSSTDARISSIRSGPERNGTISSSSSS